MFKLRKIKKGIERTFCCKVISITSDKIIIKPDNSGYNMNGMCSAISAHSGVKEVSCE